MRQVVQDLRSGEVIVADVPRPVCQPDGIVVETLASLVSAGTERMVVDFARSNLVQKALARPDLVKQALTKARREGVAAAFEAVSQRLNTLLPLGYSSAGRVVEVGAGVAHEYRVGDLVACCGGRFACHAEAAFIPRNLAVSLGEGVDAEAGAFGAVAAIGLHGLRLADIQVGASVCIVGLGLLGQLAAQIAAAAGYLVLGTDTDPARVDLARQLGLEHSFERVSAEEGVLQATRGRGADAVLICAETPSDDPIVFAGTIARERAAVVAVGAVGLSVPRKTYYEKELQLRISRSYGPGRYDVSFEEQGHDYPIGYVRWTEQRNLEAVVDLMRRGALRPATLVTHRFDIARAGGAYDLVTGKTGEPYLAVLLTYPGVASRSAPAGPAAQLPAAAGTVGLGVVGAGNFAANTLLPALRGIPDLELASIASAQGLTAYRLARRFRFARTAASYDELLQDPAVNTVAILTRHNLHAAQAVRALQAGRHVFVEKPLALDERELATVRDAWRAARDRRLMVGFNRRFAPLAVACREFLTPRHGPLVATYRINAGSVPPGHWIRDAAVGGGRLIGEVCHFIDWLSWLVGTPPVSVFAAGGHSADAHTATDDVAVVLGFADGSVGTVLYATDGDRAVSKERIEVFGAGRVALLDDFRILELVANGRRRVVRHRWRSDKGHRGEWQAFASALCTGAPDPISPRELFASHLSTFAARASLADGTVHRVDVDAWLA
ncbi:MAG: bi-domain-containing oxidoreductase [Gemmatimonadales bacterium]